MATPRTPNQKKQYAKLNARLAKYGKLVEQLYDKFNREAAKIAMRTGFDPDSEKMFRFQDYPQTRDAIQKLLAEYMSDMTGTINRTTSVEWENSNEFQDLVANKVLKAYGVKAKDGTEYERYYQTNSDHLKAFQTRTVNGMNLSRRVWNLKEQYKQELEMGLSVGIERGISATSLAKQMKQYLNEPDKLFRRVRDKYGNLQLSKNAKAYHPGRGVYRSSYKNAMRLTRSETNMAYRTAEQTRWRQFDFVVGYEIKLSQSHPCHDVCDELAGKYPKDFVWTGWHPMDMCYCVSILKSEDEFWRDLGNEENSPKSEKEVTDVPDAFKDWVKDNADRIEAAEKRGTQPYFIRDNKEYIQGILKPAERESDANTTISPKEVKKTPQEIAAEHHVARTQEDITESSVRINSKEEAVERAKTYGIASVDFTTASLEEVNTILEVFHNASREYGISIDKLWLADLRKIPRYKGYGGFYDADKKLLALDLSGFTSSSYKEIKSYSDKIAKLNANKASLLRQVEQSEARLGRSKSSDRILKADIKALKSRILDIDVKIKEFDKLANAGFDEIPFTVADSFKDTKSQMQARAWHEIGHHIDERLGRLKFKEGNIISEYSKDMRGEEFAEWFSQYKMRGPKNIPNDLLKIFRKAEYNRYGERKWQQLYFDSDSGGYNVAHSMHQFKNSRPKGVSKTGGEAEKWLGNQLAKQGKTIEFLPESGLNGKSGDMRFDGKVWDCKYIPLANENTIRSCLKDARKADCVIFTTCGEADRYNDIIKAVDREIGRYKSQGKNIEDLPDVYIFDKGQLRLVKKLKGA